MKIHLKLQLLLLAITIFSVNASAFRLEPMVANFSPEGNGAAQIFRVENEAKEPVAVKIQAFTRQIDENGKETQVVSRNFKIFPEQISLAASDSRAIRVTYIGPKSLEQEASYRIVASQLPVNFKQEVKKTGIKFLFQYVASVYVTLDKYYPKIELESIERTDKDNLKIKVINKGPKHVILKYVNIEIKDSTGKTVNIGKDLIKDWDTENILSGSRRVFKVKSSLNFDLQKNKPKIDVKDEI